MIPIRGVLDSLVLAVLADAPAHGYAISARLEELGAGEIAGGTLYPVLKKLDKAGFINADWELGESGPARKVYLLTKEGKAHLAEQRTAWQQTRAMVDQILLNESVGGVAAANGKAAS